MEFENGNFHAQKSYRILFTYNIEEKAICTLWPNISVGKFSFCCHSEPSDIYDVIFMSLLCSEYLQGLKWDKTWEVRTN